MNSPATFRFSKPISYIILLFMISLIHSVSCAPSNPTMGLCHRSYKCGNLSAGFPFWGETRHEVCGHPLLNLRCENASKTTILEISGVSYIVLKIDANSNSVKLVRQDSSSICSSFAPQFLYTSTLPTQIFEASPDYDDFAIFYHCDERFGYLGNFTCPWSGLGSVFQSPEYHRYCNESVNVTVHVSFLRSKEPRSLRELESVLREGFEVRLKIDQEGCRRCSSSGGTCLFRNTVPICCGGFSSSGFRCELMNSSAAGGDAGDSNGKTIGIGIGVGLLAVLLAAGGLFCFCRQRRKKRSARYTSQDLPPPPHLGRGTTTTPTSTTVSRNLQTYQSSNSNLGNISFYFGVKVFSYEELKEATENFSKELGDGGYGTVYYGVLRDGRAVAVKCLYERSLKRVEQFKNEIEILKSLKHPNLVILYGCTSRHSRELLLVYEYIPNGTLADHIHGDRVKSHPLSWTIRFEIAIETASALSYLHASGIIHRDVKTTNILLDNNFQVKVADFGLSRLFPTDATHVSTAPQGTPGYVDPEYYQCYRLNEKSDVYSFGVVLAELISSKAAVDITRHQHDINLANMVIARIQNSAVEELVDPDLGFDRDFAVRRMVTAVAELAFRCLQQERVARPSMDEVVETLKGIQKEEMSEPAEMVDIGAGGGCGGDDVGLLRNGGAPPPVSPETDKWTNSSNSNNTTASSL